MTASGPVRPSLPHPAPGRAAACALGTIAIALALIASLPARTVPAKMNADEPPERAEAAPVEPIEAQPYRIVLHFGCHPSSRLDGPSRADLLREWQVLTRRFIGAPWSLTIAPPASRLLALDLEAPDASEFADVGPYDKVWVVHADRSGDHSELTFRGREYDTATRRLGPIQQAVAVSLVDAPRAFLEFTVSLFSPTAVIAGQAGGRALLKVRGSTLEPASPLGQVAPKGTVFQALRLIELEKGKILVRTIAYTYLQVESMDGPIARCTIASAFRDPLTQRMSRPNTLAGVGLKPGHVPTRLRFVNRANQRPAAGYTLTCRSVPDGPPRELGLTDRSGRIELAPGFASGLVVLRLLAGGIEPVVELPLMPGESAEERTVPIRPLPLAVALESRIHSLRDEVVDLVALRARLIARMEARLDGTDWAGLEDTINEFDRLPPRETLAKRLTQLKDEATRRQVEEKATILTKTAQALLNDVQAMIDRYLDDETVKAFTDAIAQHKEDVAAAEQAARKQAARKQTAARRPKPRPAPAAKSETTQKAPSARPMPKASQPAAPAVPF